MSSLTTAVMRAYLCRSLSSNNANKLRGILAEIEFRHHLNQIGFLDRVSPGGWIARRVGPGKFGSDTVVMLPEAIVADEPYPLGRQAPQVPNRLHAIAATFHQSGIHAFSCIPEVATQNDALSVTWRALQLGVPETAPWEPFPDSLSHRFSVRRRRYEFLRYNADCSRIPASAVGEEFSKEHLRVTFQSVLLSEISDVDGIFWGQQFTYPLEIKEKTAAQDSKLGPYFGLDLGPFVKLAFYAVKRGNLRSLFIVREIEDEETRALVNWWFITFEQLAEFASWLPRSGGRSMTGGTSAVVRIPRAQFASLTTEAFRQL